MRLTALPSKDSVSAATSRPTWSAYVWVASAAESANISVARTAYRWERNGNATSRQRSPLAVSPGIR